MNSNILILRTKNLSLDIIRFCNSLPHNSENLVISRQLLRSGTSVGANYRAACRAKSLRDFINKLSIVEEEGDESLYWLELLKEILHKDMINKADSLIKEMNEIVAIIVSAKKTSRLRLNRKS